MTNSAHLFVGVSENLSHEFPDLPVVKPINTHNNLPAIGRPYDATIILIDGSLSRKEIEWFERLSRTLNPFFVESLQDAHKVVNIFMGQEP